MPFREANMDAKKRSASEMLDEFRRSGYNVPLNSWTTYIESMGGL